MKTSKLTSIVFLIYGAIFSSAFASDILPHQVHYALDIENLNMAGMTTSRGGDFFLRIERGCNSWTIASQFSFNLESDDNIPVAMVMLSQWEETLDGQSMSFLSQTIVNGTTVDLYEGVANNGKDKTEGQLYLTQPEQTTHILPPEVYFPLSATLHSIENMNNGIKVQNYVLYDGAAKEAMRVSDLIIGKAVQPDGLPDSVKPYIEGEGWKVVTSFFDYGNADSEATSTHVADIYENGVTTKLKISNPQLTAIGRLDQFEALSMPVCN